MTLSEAIEHAEQVAQGCEGECADDHRQLAEWLRELVALRAENERLARMLAQYGLFSEVVGDPAHEFAILRRDLHALERENIKLRALMHDTYDCICEMYRYMDGRYACMDAEADYAYGPILKRMRELGIEVGE